MITHIRKANAEFALSFGSILSWPIWLPAILLGSLIGWVFHENDLIMLLLTIQTSVDSAATKMLQNHVRNKDEARDMRNDARDQRAEEMLTEIKSLVSSAAARDRQAAKQGRMMLAAISAQNDLLDFIVKGGTFHNETARKTRRRTSRPR